MKKARVLFEYQPQEDDELTLGVGDIILEVEPADTGWCKGLLNGKRGMFPDNFVQIFEEEEKKAPLPPAATKKPSKKKVRRMKVLFPYKAENSDEISLEVGDVIEILKDIEEGWAEGFNRGKKGVFPTNFGEILEGSSESEESGDGGVEDKIEEPEPKATEEFATSSQKKVKGVGLGNIFAGQPIKLRQTSIGESDKKKNLSTPSPAKTPAKEKEKPKEVEYARPKKAVDYCRVMFDYAKENDDELGLTKGEILIISNKNPGDDGWWEGEKVDDSGKRIRGVFPDNFVQELTPDEVREHEKHFQLKNEPETSKVKTPNKETKKVTPLVPVPPSQGMKPALTNDLMTNDATDSAFSEPHTTEHTLAHVKRPGGPKNRRKPGAAERREKAAAATETIEQNGETTESEDEKPKSQPEPTPAPKKDSTKRGVAVLPGLGAPGGEGGPGETPSWLQNLKNRQSTKRPPPAAPGPKEPSPSEAGKPAWLANLKKRQSSEFPATAAPVPKEKIALQPKPAVDKAKPAAEKPAEKPSNGHAALVPPVKPVAAKPAPKPSPPSPTDKPLAAWQIERQQKARKSKTETNEDKAPEPPAAAASGDPAAIAPQPSWKNSLTKTKSPTAVKSPTETHPPIAVGRKPDKPPVGTPLATPVSGVRTKPAPPKGKPAPPAVKPASTSAVEELKSEIKHMKEEMDKVREEMKKEILRLNSELENEKNHRIALEDEVRKLRQQLS